MSEIRRYIDLIESAQSNQPLDEASPFRNAMAGALAAGMAIGSPKAAMAPISYSAAIETPHTKSLTHPVSHASEISVSAPDEMTPRPIARPDGRSAMAHSPRPQERPQGLTKTLGDTTTQNASDAISGSPSEADDPSAYMDGEPEFKRNFVRDMMPRIEQENAAIRLARSRIERLKTKGSLTPDEQAYVEDCMKYYRVKDGGNFDALLAKMNVIPPSLILAQAALESGWGRSKLAKEQNALFGQKASASGYSAFQNRTESIRSYIRNLNSHGAYKELRAARNAMIKDGTEPSGVGLAKHLLSYSTRGEAYVADVIKMIRSNGFNRLDG